MLLRISRPIALSLAAGAMLGCQTPYQPAGVRGGYSNFEVSLGVHYVAFEANGYTARGTVMEYWHRRAQEICGGPGTYEVLSSADISREQLLGGSGSITSVRKPAQEGYVRCLP